MGARLVVTVKSNQKEIAKIYYHGSAYTLSALDIARVLVGNFYDEDFIHIKDEKLRLIKIVEALDGGVEKEDYEYVKNLFSKETFKRNTSKYSGWICLSKERRKEIQNYAEANLIIDFDKRMVFNNLFFQYDNKDQLKEEYARLYGTNSEEILKEKRIQYIDLNPQEIAFEDIDNLINELDGKEFDIIKCKGVYYECFDSFF